MSGSGGPNDSTRAARARHRSAVAAALAGHGITLHEVIGRGASCTVHRGRQADGRTVAVKVARPGARDAAALLHREARVLRRLHDLRVPPAPGPTPFVVQLVAEIRDPEVAALVTTPCGTGTLGRGLGEASAGPATAADHHLHLELIRRVLAAVHALHQIGVTHGDLSPANIVLVDGQPVLVDLATACIDGWCDPMIRGTLPYAAPELLHGAAPSVRSDLFSVARIMTDLLNGTPVAGPGTATAPGSPDGSPTLLQVLAACTASDPRQRPPDLTALVEAVDLERSRRSAAPAHLPAPAAPGGAVGAPGHAASTRGPLTPPPSLAAPPVEAHGRTARTRPFGLRSDGAPPAPPLRRPHPRPDRPWWRRTPARLRHVAASVAAATRAHPRGPTPSAGPSVGGRGPQAGGRRASTAGSSTPML